MSSAFSSIRQGDRRHHVARMGGQIAQPAMWAAILIQAAWILAAPGDRAGSYDLLVLVTFAVLGATRVRIRGMVAIARVVLAVSFLGSVADRFGLFGSYGTAGVSWGSFARFVDYTRDVDAFLPAGAAPTLAVLATGAEVGLGLALLVGFRTRRAVVGAALLLAVFGRAMTLSLGATSPLSYDVWVLATGAWMMAGSNVSCLTLDTVVARFRRRRVAPAGYSEVVGTPRELPRLGGGFVTALRIIEREGERIRADVHGPMGIRDEFAIVLRPGWCWMEGRVLSAAMAARAEGEGTRFGWSANVRLPGGLLLRPLSSRALDRTLIRLEGHVRGTHGGAEPG